jgi:hypothetical protein
MALVASVTSIDLAGAQAPAADPTNAVLQYSNKLGTIIAGARTFVGPFVLLGTTREDTTTVVYVKDTQGYWLRANCNAFQRGGWACFWIEVTGSGFTCVSTTAC